IAKVNDAVCGNARMGSVFCHAARRITRQKSFDCVIQKIASETGLNHAKPNSIRSRWRSFPQTGMTTRREAGHPQEKQLFQWIVDQFVDFVLAANYRKS